MNADASPSRPPNTTSLTWGDSSHLWKRKRWKKWPVLTATRPLRQPTNSIRDAFTTSPCLSTLAAEPVSDRAHRLEMFRMGGIRLEVFAEPDDKIVQGPGFGVAAVAPDGLQQIAPMNCLPLFLEKQ